MYIAKNVPLKSYSTMRLGGPARYMVEVSTANEVAEAVKWAKAKKTYLIMIGEGTNIIWKDKGFPGLVMVNKVKGFRTQAVDDKSMYVTVGAGEEWDDVVERCVSMGLSGIEQLSFIPGTAGATPVQNVGAYGREISEVLVTVEAYDAKEDKLVVIANSDCEFGYRTSRFKKHDKDRFFITAITLLLTKTNPQPPFYASLQKYLDEHSITAFTPRAIREAVIAVRTSKLPDPDVVANNGSFFANPIISQTKFEKLRKKFPDIVNWPQDNGKVKLSAAWLIEQAGFKDYHDEETGMATWNLQSLVLINEHAKSTKDLLKFREKIVDKILAMFDVKLEQEPELI